MCVKSNNYFLQIPEDLRILVQIYPTDDFNNLQVYQEEFRFCHTTIDEVLEIITELDINKSCGYDGISGKCIFECKDIMVPHQAGIRVNPSVSFGRFF